MQWIIQKLESTQQDGGVIKAYWLVRLEQDGHQATASGSTEFKPDPDATEFVPYENLTEQNIIDWVKEKLGQEKLAAISTDLDAQIAHKKTQGIVRNLPWADQK